MINHHKILVLAAALIVTGCTSNAKKMAPQEAKVEESAPKPTPKVEASTIEQVEPTYIDVSEPIPVEVDEAQQTAIETTVYEERPVFQMAPIPYVEPATVRVPARYGSQKQVVLKTANTRIPVPRDRPSSPDKADALPGSYDVAGTFFLFRKRKIISPNTLDIPTVRQNPPSQHAPLPIRATP